MKRASALGDSVYNARSEEKQAFHKDMRPGHRIFGGEGGGFAFLIYWKIVVTAEK
jgi:hypothetical protein